MTRKQKRFTVIFGALALLGVAVALVLTALSEQVTFFRTPSELLASPEENAGRLRLGGLVETGSVTQGEDSQVEFAVEDTNERIVVRYAGILPDLFREGQGVVAEGRLQPDGTFLADTVLAKHDETYMPKEVADSLKEQGFWQGEEGTATQ
ncbi:cytochrome c maturation protein CcmE [Oricola cellulosilytica]|uniref:Cytochrome c-type biogenesis protein CcmE n=1 Tax=Oricola cellulosilytica TaxID=1429082 RepID=A0A4R0PF74_9HYPH|nr:cytochrome c maturation protein CcmE [Oricola cellulosilytica]TCD14134.1 cytochrome c maturation protein CcmE [Oricola cellulosilytica]